MDVFRAKCTHVELPLIIGKDTVLDFGDVQASIGPVTYFYPFETYDDVVKIAELYGYTLVMVIPSKNKIWQDVPGFFCLCYGVNFEKIKKMTMKGVLHNVKKNYMMNLHKLNEFEKIIVTDFINRAKFMVQSEEFFKNTLNMTSHRQNTFGKIVSKNKKRQANEQV